MDTSRWRPRSLHNLLLQPQALVQTLAGYASRSLLAPASPARESLIRLGETQWLSGIDELRLAVDLKTNDPDYLMSLGDGYYDTH